MVVVKYHNNKKYVQKDKKLNKKNPIIMPLLDEGPLWDQLL